MRASLLQAPCSRFLESLVHSSGEGECPSVTIPKPNMKRDDLPAPHLSSHDSQVSVRNPSGCRHHTPVVLLVDDDEDNLLLMSYVLEPLHCSMITALDGQSALLAAQTEQPDLIVLDIMLSKLNGIQVVSQLKQNPQTMEIPVVAVTAMARDEDRERILQAGCNDYMSKPFMIDALEAMVRHHLHRPQPIP